METARSQLAVKTTGRGYTYRISAVAAAAGLLFGYDTAVINGALLFLRQQFQLTDPQTELAAGSLLWGCIVGAGLAGAASDAWGRRKVLLGAAFVFGAAAIGCALPRGLGEFVAARLTCGIAIGLASVLAPVYIAEVSPPALRGRLVSLNQLAIVSGILIAYSVNWRMAALGPESWRWMFAVAALPSVLFFAGLFFIPETPRWLLKQGRDSEAHSVLLRVNSAGEADRELQAIRDSLAEEAAAKLSDLLRPGLRRALALALCLAILQQVTGINTVLYYGSIIFKEMTASGGANSALAANVTIGMVNLVCTVIALFTIDLLGRRLLLMAGAAGMALALFALMLVFQIQPPPPGLVLSLILLYVACFALSLGPGVWVYISEIFPTGIRGRAMSVATLALWFACLLVTLTFLSLVSALTPAGAFGVYAVFCVLTVLLVWRFVPETKGRALEEIQRFWRP